MLSRLRLNSVLLGVAILCWGALATAATEVGDDQYVIFYHNDMLGSPTVVTDHNGNVLWHEHSEPFGRTRARTSSSKNEFFSDHSGSRKGYTGHLKDDGADLVYMKARYYDPVIGRFYSNDPVGFTAKYPMMFNRYAYGYNNPYTYYDPLGETPYLVSRPIGHKVAGKYASHNFVVSNANYIGDPKADVHSFGETNEGKAGKVDGSTTTDSANTSKDDKKYWDSLANDANLAASSTTEIKATDQGVYSLANRVIENRKYRWTPLSFMGKSANSNSISSAIANEAEGQDVDIPDGNRVSPGAGSAHKIEFDESPYDAI